ncbi:CD225/dispanin family protein [Flavobacteriaceae bacterium Ap0902]|nr:CD225/dispanin family protein [Flavobacteriaceae bacterium Ap0902]
MENNQISNYEVPPQNFMTLSIIATILGCCTCSLYGISFILGIVGIYFASQVNTRFYSGDIDGAEKNANYAKIFSLVSIGIVVLSLSYAAYVYLKHPEIYIEQREMIEEMMKQYGIETE